MNPESGEIFLGKSTIQIPLMGIGAWAWGDRFYWGYGKDYGESHVKKAFETCVDAGINFFDTAEIYGQGRSERLLGQFIQSLPDEAPPIIVASKFYPYPWRLRNRSLINALQGSLRRLKIPIIDLYQIHQPFPPIPIESWASALADAMDEGLVGAVGVSNYNAKQMNRTHAVLIKRGYFLSSNQVEYSLLDRRIERNGMLELCKDLEITCIAYGPIAQGVLSGKYSARNPLPGIRGRRYPAKLLSKIDPLIRLLHEIGAAHEGKTASQVAINWVICKGAVPIPGVKTVEQAVENLGALGWRLTEAEVSALDDASQHYTQ